MKELLKLYAEYYGHPPDRLVEIPRSVSTRRYYRIHDGDKTVIGTFSPDLRETAAFLHFTRHFMKAGVNVPEIFTASEDQKFYLQSDLGDDRLHEHVVSRSTPGLTTELEDLYKAALDELLKLQLKGDEGLDYSVCVPRPDFDLQSVHWDLNHFKYYFLKISEIPFDEQQLEDDFLAFAEHISSLPLKHFMFRDFQTRNIMVCEGKPFLIDYQGGRRGPLQYDLASMVYESKAGLTQSDREMLIKYYLDRLDGYMEVDHADFMADFHLVALVRVLQVLGAYGLRGLVEKKAVFLQSIPVALQNLEHILEKLPQGIPGDHLSELLRELTSTKDQYRRQPPPSEDLVITIFSFSYRKPLPDDLSGNGGGFVYDCRFINNPGRQEKYRTQTGFDRDVVEFLERDPSLVSFRESIKKQLKSAVDVYKKRGFSHLMVSFGCTGGQHRSVYLAHEVAEWCRTMKKVRVVEIHREIGKEL